MHSDLAGSDTADPAVRVHVQALGRFRVHVDGTPLRFAGRTPRRPLALLKALIALGGEGVPAETLCDALWPDAEGDGAAKSLSVTLARLRRLIGPDCVRVQDARVSLEPRLCWVDAFACGALLEQAPRHVGVGETARAVADLARALELYRGPLLEGEFDPAPVLSARERLHGQLLQAVEQVARAHEAVGDLDASLALYRRALERDDQAEGLYQGILRMCLATGRHAEGLAAYRRCRDVLRTALDTAPGPESEGLRAQLQAAVREAPPVEALLPPERGGAAAPSQVALAAAEAPAGSESLRRRRRRIALAVLAVLGLGVAAVVAVMDPAPPRLPWAPPESVRPLAAQPSLAVLPFANLTGDPQQDYLSTGLSEELTTRLAALEGLRVVATASALEHRGASGGRLGRELGVRYVLEGAVRRDGGRLRISARLLEVASGRYLWAQGFERDDGGPMAAQEEILRGIVGTLRVPLAMGAEGWSRRASTDDVQAWEQYLRGLGHMRQGTTLGYMLARYRFEDAVQLDPDFSAAILGIGWTLYRNYRLNLGGGGLYLIDRAEDAVRRARELEGELAEADALQAGLHLLRGNHEQALTYARHAVALSPGAAEWQAVLAEVLAYAGDNGAALEAIRAAMRRSPVLPDRYRELLGGIYYNLERYEDAAAVLQPLYDRRPAGAHDYLAASHAALGRRMQARTAARGLAEVLAVNAPAGLPLAAWVEWKRPYRDAAYRERLLGHLAPLVEP